MLPPPRIGDRSRRLTHQEERRLEVDVDLEVPIVLGDLVDIAAPAQHGGDMGQMVEAAVAGNDPPTRSAWPVMSRRSTQMP